MSKDDEFMRLIAMRRPGKVVDCRAIMQTRYGKGVRILRPRGSIASMFVFHHSDTPTWTGVEGVLAATWDYHIKGKHWETGGYAILVDIEGTIYVVGNPFADMTYNAGPRWNPITVAVCSIGNFQSDNRIIPVAEPSAALLQSLYSVGISLDDASGVPGGRPWRPHRAIRQTACPGDLLVPHVWAMTGKRYGAANPRPEIYP